MTESSDERDIRAEFQLLAYMIVHHLKEPARAIRTGAELLLEGEQEPDHEPGIDTSVASCAGRILRGVIRLDDITASIAQYADDLGNEDEPLEEVNTESVVRSAKLKLGRLIEQTGAVISNGALPGIKCQPARFSSLIEHLLRNAVLYRRDDAPVVRVSAEREGEAWLFSISDNGMGIRAADLERIFNPFDRLNSNGYKGLGMGLTTSRKIVAHHGGRIWVESTPGVGSTVFFTLPQ